MEIFFGSKSLSSLHNHLSKCPRNVERLMCKLFTEKVQNSIEESLRVQTKDALIHLSCTKARENTSKSNMNWWTRTTREKFRSINQRHETKASKRKKSIMAWMLQNVLGEQKTVKYLSLNLIILKREKEMKLNHQKMRLRKKRISKIDGSFETF